MATLGTVVSVTGEAFVVDPNGNKKLIKLGDTVQPGDTIITMPGVVVELQLVNGRTIEISGDETVKFTQDLVDIIQPDSSDSALDQATIQSVIQAIEDGRDINEVLEETSAGFNAPISNNYGFSFVELLRIDEVLNRFNFQFDRFSEEISNTERLEGRLVPDDSSDNLNTSVTAGNTTTPAVNHPPVISSGVQAGTVTEDSTLTASGQVTATDADTGATLSYSGSAAGT
ncbi:MAG TPA: retention module-containing protein, partial [Methylophilaceae bacterium]|nr:retention module-containing protein [Methylophilaceae bacterium]